MGRDEALADRLFSDHKLHILGEWENPGLSDKAAVNGGIFQKINSTTDVTTISDYIEHVQPDMFLTNLDDALAAGIVDSIRNRVETGHIKDLLIPCPSKEASRIEWDKFYLRELIDEIDPGYNPTNFMTNDREGVYSAIHYFKERNLEIAIKPRGLTGGKGVKVMGKHFNSHEEGMEYALKYVGQGDDSGVEIQEKIIGNEFTLQLITDGKTIIEPPTTYDYPYREDGDHGPGTGGMGSFSMEDGLLPFIGKSDYTEAVDLMSKLLVKLQDRDIGYKGVLYPTFFKTNNGLKIVETNARGGDPELINIVDSMEDNVDLAQVLKSLAVGDLDKNQVSYKKCGSAVVYLVSPDYGYNIGTSSYGFSIDKSKIESADCKIRFSATEQIGDKDYVTIGSSRNVAVSALGKTAWDAHSKIINAIEMGFQQPMPLQFRTEIADENYIKNLK